MPIQSVWAVRLSLLYLIAGASIGAWLLIARGVGGGGGIAVLVPVHIELLLIGFMVQLALGVAYWILPRTAVRTAVWPFMVVLVVLNATVAMSGIGTAMGADGLVMAARLGQVFAVAMFVVYVWPRVRPLLSSTER